MQNTLVIIKPSAIQRGLVGEVISRFEKKGLQIVGFKMMYLTDEMLKIHYAHLKNKPFLIGYFYPFILWDYICFRV